MILLVALALIAIAIIRPKNLLTKIFRVEEIELLHRRNRREFAETYTIRDWTRRAIWRGSFYVVTTWTSLLCLFGTVMSLTPSFALATVLATSLLSIYARWLIKSSRETVPLYLALSRVSGCRWNITDSPMKWVRVWPDEIRIRLPRDQHTTPVMVKQIQDLVTGRMRGQWTMKADIPGFLITFSVSRPVPVSVATTESPASVSATPTVSDMIPVQVVTEEDDSGPW